MNPSAWQTGRRLVPRWRSLASTLHSGELASALRNEGERNYALSQDLVHRLEEWRLTPSLITAAELVEAAIVEGREGEAINAARRLVASDMNAAPLIREQAAALLKRAGHTDEVPADLMTNRRNDASRWRHLCRLHPHDPLAWVELAFHHTVRGHGKPALRSMMVAMDLAPNNRHVLRSASRLFLHQGDPERAHDIIVRSPATRTDPWLLAAEIALAEVADRDPRFFKLGVRLVEDGGLLPRQITELAGAVATAELLEGSRKKSKRMFVRSMADPTGNSLAQGEWATPELGPEIVPLSRFASVYEAFEAQAFHLYREFNFADVPGICESWAEVDPYSVRPFEFGSTAAAYAEDFDKAEELARRGLQIRPSAPMLLNFRSFALASMGRVDEAKQLLRKVATTGAEDRLSLLTTANKGLVAFRQGHFELGKQQYQEAIEGFRRIGLPTLSAHARVFLAREAALANLPEATKLLSEARQAVDKFKNTEAAVVLQKVERALGLPVAETSMRLEPMTVPSAPKPRTAANSKNPTTTWTKPGLPPRKHRH